MRAPRPFVLGSLLTLLLAAPAATQHVAAQQVEPFGPFGPGPRIHRDRLCVKLAEGCGAELVGGHLLSRVGVDLSRVDGWFQQGAASPLVTALTWDELDRWHRRACEVLPEGRRPGHMGLWFRLQAPTAAVADFLADRLAAEPLVTDVYHEPVFAPACAAPPQDIPPPTPSLTQFQHTFEPSPYGHGIWLAQGVLGARGQGVALRMVEFDFYLDHEDVPSLVAANVMGALPPGQQGLSNHGVAAAGLLTGERNDYGLTGVVDEIDMAYIAFPQNGGVENSMFLAAASCQPGDVVLTVLQFLLGQYGNNDWVPLEFLQATFDATLTVSANGRIVVNNAANGSASLDDPRFLRRFDRTFRDSGAIMVSSSAAGALQRAAYANWGSRIDAHSWGDDVVAAGYGTHFFPNNDRRQAYTQAYSGTSAGSTTTCGIVCLLQGAARRQLGRSLTAAEILQLFATHGPATNDGIGRRPDVPAILRSLGILDGLSMAAPDTPVGGSFTVQMEGPQGSAAVLFGSFGVSTPGLDLGLNRRVHLDQASLFTVGFFPMPQGVANWSLTVPNNSSLAGLDLYFQAGRVAGAAPLHVTNSCQATVF